MIQPPLIRLLVQIPVLEFFQIPSLPLLHLGQPLLPQFVADDADVDGVVVAGVGREQAVVSVWRVGRQPTV